MENLNQYSLSGSGILKKRVLVKVETDKIEKDIRDSYTKKCIHFLEKILDNKAKEYHYDNILSACSYCASDIDMQNNPFHSESLRFFQWRNKCWRNVLDLAQNTSIEKIKGLKTKDIEKQVNDVIPYF